MKNFLEIGTADFETLIPLAEKGGWIGWCVEPMPHFCETLRSLTGHLPVAIEELAISDYNGWLQMAVANVKGGTLVRGASHVVSDHHYGVRPLDNSDAEIIDVQCLTLDTFLEYKGIKHLDYLKLDTEGHELNILEDYSWRVKPSFIKAETTQQIGNGLKSVLVGAGYTVTQEKHDLYAIL